MDIYGKYGIQNVSIISHENELLIQRLGILGCSTETPEPPPNPSLIIHIRRLTTVFFSKLYIILPCRGKTYPSHVIGKGICRTYANKIAMNDKIMKKVAGTEKEGKKYMKNLQHLVVLGIHPSRHYPDWHCLTSLRRPDFFGTHNH